MVISSVRSRKQTSRFLQHFLSFSSPTPFLSIYFQESHCTLTRGREKCLEQALPRVPKIFLSQVMSSNQMKRKISRKCNKTINSIFEINARLNLMNIIPFYLMPPFSRTDIKYCSFHFTKANEEKNALQKSLEDEKHRLPISVNSR